MTRALNCLCLKKVVHNKPLREWAFNSSEMRIVVGNFLFAAGGGSGPGFFENGLDGPATSGRLRLLRTNQPGGRRSQSRPYSTKSTHSSASFTIPSCITGRANRSASLPRSDPDPTASPGVPVAIKLVRDTITWHSPDHLSSFPFTTSPSRFHTRCAGSIAPPAVSKSRPFLGRTASTPAVMSFVTSLPVGPSA